MPNTSFAETLSLHQLVGSLSRVGVKKIAIVRGGEGGWLVRGLHAELGTGAATGATREGALEALLSATDRSLGYDEPRCCSICDGMGHGYPGGGPCPTEMTGEPMDEREERAVAEFEEEMRASMGGRW